MLVDVHNIDAKKRIQRGIYEVGNWSPELDFRGRQVFELDFPELDDDFNNYGVCDSPDQLKRKMPKSITTSDLPYVITMVKLRKSEMDPEGGWRWHKWGPYIGTQKPQREYLYDEPVIEEVWTYHIYLVAATWREASQFLTRIAD